MQHKINTSNGPLRLRHHTDFQNDFIGKGVLNVVRGYIPAITAKVILLIYSLMFDKHSIAGNLFTPVLYRIQNNNGPDTEITKGHTLFVLRLFANLLV